jgi:GAF domain-containing protein
MSPSVLFWLTTAVGLIVAIVALALAFLAIALAVVRRSGRRLNWAYVLFAGAAVTICGGSTLAHVESWLVTQGRADQAQHGGALFWAEVAVAGYLLLGPSLLVFAHEFARFRANRTDEGAPADGNHGRLRRTVVSLGFLAALGLLPVVFGHRVVDQLVLNDAGRLQADVTPLGTVIAIGPMLYALLALIRFWQHRIQVGGKWLTFSTGLWLVTSATAVGTGAPWALTLFCLGMAVLAAGYVVISQQLLVPMATLSRRFDSELADRTRELEHVRDRLQWHNELQRRVAAISREIAQCDEPSQMLAELAGQILSRLGHQHVYVYLADSSGDDLFIQAAAGTTARTILDSKHRLAIGGNSLAGKVAAEHRPLLADDKANGILFAGTALPGARSEMSVPMIVKDRLLGVLDFQSIHPGAFSDEDLDLITCLADQAAVTLETCQSFHEIKSAIAEDQAAQREQIRHTWRAALAERAPITAFVWDKSDQVTATTLGAVWSPDIARVARTGRAFASQSGDSERDGPVRSGSVLTLPVSCRGQVIGALRLSRETRGPWESDEIETLGLIADRLGLAMENANHLEAAQQRGRLEQFISGFAAKLREESDVESLLDIATREIGDGLGLAALDVRLGTEDDLQGESGEVPRTSVDSAGRQRESNEGYG